MVCEEEFVRAKAVVDANDESVEGEVPSCPGGVGYGFIGKVEGEVWRAGDGYFLLNACDEGTGVECAGFDDGVVVAAVVIEVDVGWERVGVGDGAGEEEGEE